LGIGTYLGCALLVRSPEMRELVHMLKARHVSNEEQTS
jgi:hypothetical protein